MDLLTKALNFAMSAHASINQKRKYTGEDYIVHPIAVAETVKKYGGDKNMIAAAYLHDTVEDTAVTIDDICNNFGPLIGVYVDGLTDESINFPDLNRKARKAIDREKLAHASREVQFVKCADLIDNTKSILEHDANFARVYMSEKRLLLDVMTKVQDTPIWNEANKIVEDYYKKDVDNKVN